MDVVMNFLGQILVQLQSANMAFLIAGFVLALFRSGLHIPQAIYDFVIFMLLIRIGMAGGREIKEAGFQGLIDMALPALACVIIGVVIVLIGSVTLAKLPGVKKDDAMGTAGLFGAVSGGTLMAGMLAVEQAGIYFEGWMPALYPFMDIPALIAAVVIGNLYLRKERGETSGEGKYNFGLIKEIIKESVTSFAISALIIGLLLGVFANTTAVFEGFYDQLFQGFLSVLMLTLGMEAARHLKDLISIGHWYVLYAALGPFVHGLIGFGFGYVLYHTVGLSPGGVILLAVIAASNSDISGPPTIRGGLPSANPAAYIGSSTGVGTPVAIVFCIPLFITMAQMVFGI